MKSIEKEIKIDDININVYKSGIKSNKTDVLWIELPVDSSIAGVFTKSKTSSAAVKYCKKNLSPNRDNNTVKSILVNSGNANAFTGKKGEKTVSEIIKFLSDLQNCNPKEIFTASTGVIGEFLDSGKIINSIKKDMPFSKNSWLEASKAIMTTDTFHKISSTKCKIENEEVNIIGIAKGSGMIAPNMATMLAFIFTDANISSQVLQKILLYQNERTFNSISVDSDTSTSDTVLLVSTNKKNNRFITSYNDPKVRKFENKIYELMLSLAKQIVRDGEGASKFIELNILNAKSFKAAKKIGMSIANSPLVKTAIAGEDANWGRIIMAIGKSYEKIIPNKIKIYFGNHLVTKNGMKYSNYSERIISKYLKKEEIHITIDLSMGNKNWKVYTCDFTEKYIKINADYRS